MHRVEHTQHVPKSWLKNEADGESIMSSLISSIQPLHMIGDTELIKSHLGSENFPFAYPFKTIRDQFKAKLLMGSDWPVVEVLTL